MEALTATSGRSRGLRPRPTAPLGGARGYDLVEGPAAALGEVPVALREEISETLRLLEDLLAKVPGPLRGEVVSHLAELRKLLLDQRAPRFALVGRRGSGKSSLINAIFGSPVSTVGHETATTGQARWERYAGPLGELEILDTRGLQEGSRPAEADPARTAEVSILTALEQYPPDVFLFLVKATEADAAILGDLEGLERICGRLSALHGHRPPVVAVLTQCDLVEPKNVRLHARDEEPLEDYAEKVERIERIRRHLDGKISERAALRDDLVRVVPISAYLSWRRDGAIRADERWNIDGLLTYLLDELPDEGKVEMVRLSQVTALRAALARRIVHACAALAATIAAVPIPVADVLPLTALQVQMVLLIGHIGGRQVDLRAAAEFFAGLGVHAAAGVGLREVARALVKLIPGAGSVASAVVATAGTKAIGEAAIAYFIGGADLRQARRTFEEVRGRPG